MSTYFLVYGEKCGMRNLSEIELQQHPQRSDFWEGAQEIEDASLGSITQQHDALVRPRAVLMTAAAQPTPD